MVFSYIGGGTFTFQILEEVGGRKNVQNLPHCVTRLRFSLHSMDGVDEQKIKNIPGVMGAVN